VKTQPYFVNDMSHQLAKTPSPVLINAMVGPSRERRSGGLVQEIVQLLETDIREGRWLAGHKLPTESDLVNRFAVSRTVVREAIARLQASGQVETRHGIGTFVSEPPLVEPTFRVAPEDLATAADVVSLLELRMSLESEAAALAAQRRQPNDLLQLEQALVEFDAAIGADSDAVPSDYRFHMEVAKATGNRHFVELMTYLGTMIIPRTRLKTAPTEPQGRLAYLRRVHQEHQQIYWAIQNQDASAARAAMRQHLSNSRERLQRAQRLGD
jgi:DNA-binding FadR family transcriptional regulator